MKKFKGVKAFNVPVYGGVVLYCKTRKAWIAVRKHYKLRKPPMRATGCSTAVFDRMEIVHIVYVGNHKYYTLAHEIIHVALAILDDVGIDIVRGEANEYFTYLVEELMFLVGKP